MLKYHQENPEEDDARFAAADALEEDGRQTEANHLRKGENYMIGEYNGVLSVLRPRYEQIFYTQGEDLDEYEQMLREHGPEALLDYLLSAGAHDPGHHETQDSPGHGLSDTLYHVGNYTIGHNPRYGYMSLEHKLGVPLEESPEEPNQMKRKAVSRRKYAAGNSDTMHLFRAIPHSVWRGHHGDMTVRGVVADHLDELGRHDEAAILRDISRHAYLNTAEGTPEVRDAADLHQHLIDTSGRRRVLGWPDARQYMDTALWSSIDDNGQPLDANYDINSIHPNTQAAMVADMEHFFALHNDAYHDSSASESDFGHDFWLTRNGHGAGFWARPEIYGDHAESLSDTAHKYGEYDLYVGDDGMIHGSYEVPPRETGAEPTQMKRNPISRRRFGLAPVEGIRGFHADEDQYIRMSQAHPHHGNDAVLADFLDDHDDPRGVIVRQDLSHRGFNSEGEPNWDVYWQNMAKYAAIKTGLTRHDLGGDPQLEFADLIRRRQGGTRGSQLHLPDGSTVDPNFVRDTNGTLRGVVTRLSFRPLYGEKRNVRSMPMYDAFFTPEEYTVLEQRLKDEIAKHSGQRMSRRRMARPSVITAVIGGDTYALTPHDDGWSVTKTTNQIDRMVSHYQVRCDPNGDPILCSCPDHFYRKRVCKHMKAVQSIVDSQRLIEQQKQAQTQQTQGPETTEKLSRRQVSGRIRFNNHEAFFKALHANNKDATASLVYADYLEENGMPTAAHIIRKHVERERKGPFISTGSTPLPMNPDERFFPRVEAWGNIDSTFNPVPTSWGIAIYNHASPYESHYHSYVSRDRLEAANLLDSLESEGLPGVKEAREQSGLRTAAEEEGLGPNDRNYTGGMGGADYSRRKFRRDEIPGGKGDTLQVSDVDPEQLKIGIEIEMEHTKNREIAREIALDHLKEDPKYYTKLKRAKLSRRRFGRAPIESVKAIHRRGEEHGYEVDTDADMVLTDFLRDNDDPRALIVERDREARPTSAQYGHWSKFWENMKNIFSERIGMPKDRWRSSNYRVHDLPGEEEHRVPLTIRDLVASPDRFTNDSVVGHEITWELPNISYSGYFTPEEAHHMFTELGVDPADYGIAPPGNQSPQERMQRRSFSEKKRYSAKFGPTYEALVRAIEADPRDQTARLALADFFEENGYPHHAAYIREAEKGNNFNHAGTSYTPMNPGDTEYSTGKTVTNSDLAIKSYTEPHTELRWAIYSPKATHRELVMGLDREGAIPFDKASKDHLYREDTHEKQSRRKFAAYRAPAGGMIARGTAYKGGMMVPDMEGDFMNPKREAWKMAKGGSKAVRVPIESILPDRENMEIAVHSLGQGREAVTTGPGEAYVTADGRYVLVDGHHRLLRAIVDGETEFPLVIKSLDQPFSTGGTIELNPDEERYGIDESLRNGWQVRRLSRSKRIDPAKLARLRVSWGKVKKMPAAAVMNADGTSGPAPSPKKKKLA